MTAAPQTPGQFANRWIAGMANPKHFHLCAIPVEGGAPRGKYCTGGSDIKAFLERHAGDNLYFSVNPLLRPLDKKAKKSDVAEVRWIHADLDPEAGKDRESERTRILALIQNPPGEIPLPHVIIDSGNGYQVFWRLEHAVTPEVGEEICKFVGSKFGADKCHNCDRVMRMPFTQNKPDARKRRAGRTSQTAYLVRFTDDKIGADAIVVAAMTPWNRAEATRAVEVGKRSESVLKFCGGCQREGVPDLLVKRILLSSAFAVSGHVRDQGNPPAYADRQIARAAETARAVPPAEASSQQQESAPAQEATPNRTQSNNAGGMSWHPLGFDNDNLHVWIHNTGTVEILPKSDNGVAGKLQILADREEWMSIEGGVFRVDGKGNRPDRFDREMAAQFVINKCKAAGRFDADGKILSKGIWREGGKTIAHLGEDLFVSDEQGDRRVSVYDQQQLGMRKLFASATPLEGFDPMARAMTSEKILELEAALGGLIWRDCENSPKVLIGWMLLAIDSGALDWRPHLWVSGAASSGKSWLQDKVIRRMLGGFYTHITAQSTPAGIRADLDGASLPVVYDEADATTKTEKERLEGLIGLARPASEKTGVVVKQGMPGGKGRKLQRVRSCFLFSSVKNSLSQTADEGRFVDILLIGGLEGDEWHRVERKILDFTEDEANIHAFRRLAIDMVKRVKSLQKEAQRVFAEQGTRSGDTIGSCLAAYAFAAGKDIGEVARAFIGDNKILVKPQQDYEQILSRLFGKRLRTSRGGITTFAICVSAVLDGALPAEGQDDPEEFLALHGIKVGEDKDGARVVYIRKDENISDEVFRGTLWESSWYATMKQNPIVRTDAGMPRIGGRQSKLTVGINADDWERLFKTDDATPPSDEEIPF